MTMPSNAKIHLVTTVSYPTMNLSLNLYEETEVQKSKEFKDYYKRVSKAQLMAVVRDKPYLPMFAPHHRIQPQVQEVVDAA